MDAVVCIHAGHSPGDRFGTGSRHEQRHRQRDPWPRRKRCLHRDRLGLDQLLDRFRQLPRDALLLLAPQQVLPPWPAFGHLRRVRPDRCNGQLTPSTDSRQRCAQLLLLLRQHRLQLRRILEAGSEPGRQTRAEAFVEQRHPTVVLRGIDTVAAGVADERTCLNSNQERRVDRDSLSWDDRV